MRLTVNGRNHDVDAAPDTALLYVLRNDLALNGPKYGCGLGECGACAVLIDGGVTSARAFVRRHILPKQGTAAPAAETQKDAKTALLHHCQHNRLGQPRYQLLDTVGLQHEQEFVVRAHILDGRGARGRGRTKRAAEKQAAAALLEQLQAR